MCLRGASAYSHNSRSQRVTIDPIMHFSLHSITLNDISICFQPDERTRLVIIIDIVRICSGFGDGYSVGFTEVKTYRKVNNRMRVCFIYYTNDQKSVKPGLFHKFAGRRAFCISNESSVVAWSLVGVQYHAFARTPNIYTNQNSRAERAHVPIFLPTRYHTDTDLTLSKNLHAITRGSAALTIAYGLGPFGAHRTRGPIP